MSRHSPWHGRAPRWLGSDYQSSGWYFLTLVVERRRPIFGHVVDGDLELSEEGEVCVEEWRRSISMRPHLKAGSFVVMPDHLHALVKVSRDHISSSDRTGVLESRWPRPRRSIGALVGCFRASVTRRINQRAGTPWRRIWQRGFHDRVVRDGREW